MRFLSNKNSVPIGIALLIAFSLTSCCINDPNDGSGGDEQASASFQYRFPAEGLTSFSIEGVNGDIDVTGVSAADSVEVWGKRIVRSDDQEDAEEHLALLTVETETANAALEVRTRQPSRNEGRNYEVVYHVRLPKTMRVSIVLVNGQISMESISNDVRVSSTNGNVVCSDIAGNCEVALVNGQIVCDAVLPPAGNCALSTVNGNVSLSIPDTTSAGLEAKVTNGEVSVSGLEIRNMRSSRIAVSGDLGSGDGTIRLTTVNGNVRLEGTR